MQFLNLDDGTAIPIKKLSDIDSRVNESKMSDRELIGLILTMKSCNDCVRLDKQMNYRAVERVKEFVCDEFEEYGLMDGNYHSIVVVRDNFAVSGFVKKLVFTFDLLDFTINLRGLSGHKGTLSGIVPGIGTCEQKGHQLIIESSHWFKRNKPYFAFTLITKVPIKLPVKITLTYLTTELPIELPEKYEFQEDYPYFKFVVHNNGRIHKIDLIDVDTKK